jgi:glucose/arabinose dehydrogenase
MNRPLASPVLIPLLAAVASVTVVIAAAAQTPTTNTTTSPSLKLVTVAHGLANPWALAFLPDGRMLVTERVGSLRLIEKDGRIGAPLEGLPTVDAADQCGLLDVVVHPQFADNHLIFFTFAEPGDPAGEGGNSTAVGRAKLVGDQLSEVRTLFRQLPKVDSNAHCGSRIVFGRDGHLWVGLGDRYSRKDDAQNMANHLGKVVRIDIEGNPAPGNPFTNRAGAAAEVFSLGHRNIQGATIHPVTGELWASEHGPQGGDEINVVESGRNYGWPLVTYGRNYGIGTRIGENGPKPGYEQPLKHWVPTSIAPSGMTFLTSERYPGWQGNLFIGALRGEMLVRLVVDGRRVVGEENLLVDLNERIRDVRQGPDGWLYVLTDSSNGQVIRLER